MAPLVSTLCNLFLATLAAASPDAGVAAPEPAPPTEPAWWKTAIIYQIYPRSFQDSNADGIGDLKGLIDRLDHLSSLGVGAVWLNPIYPSPLADTGYDISDYQAIDPQYGTLADFDRLLAEAKKRNIHVLMDLVLNHTSDQNPWFVESKSSRTNPKANWYVWRDPGPNGGPPNNWKSFDPSTKSAWEYVPARKQYYYHVFDRHQPDLNWRNPEVEKALWQAVRFWLDRGVAGFRLDAINFTYEDPQFRDNLPAKDDFAFIVNGKYTTDLPEGHGLVRRLRALLDSYPGQRVLIGETDSREPAALAAMYGKGDEMQLPMNFSLFWIKPNAKNFRKEILQWDNLSPYGWPLYFFSNHDGPRSWDRLGDGVHNDEIAKITATLLLTLRGTPIIYYGEELGLRTLPAPDILVGRDKSDQHKQPPADGRDGERTPMQWDATSHAGFSSVPPWLPVGQDYSVRNVAVETKDPKSLLSHYRALVALRRRLPALATGTLAMLDQDNPDVLTYTRTAETGQAVARTVAHTILISLNLSAQPRRVTVALPAGSKTLTTLLASPKASGRAQAGKATLVLPEFAVYIGQLR